MDKELDKEDLILATAKFLKEQGLKVYEVEPAEETEEEEAEELIPDLLGVLTIEIEIPVQIETCESLESEKAKKKMLKLAEIAKNEGGKFFLVIPTDCEDKALNIVKDLQIEDYVEVLAIL
jgi:hypothetical protein